MEKPIHWESLERTAPNWYRDTMFGLLFHWGPTAYPPFTSKDFCFTAKDGAVYDIALGWPENGKLFIRILAKSARLPGIKQVRLLGCDAALHFSHHEHGLEAALPGTKPCSYAYALKIE